MKLAISTALLAAVAFGQTNRQKPDPQRLTAGFHPQAIAATQPQTPAPDARDPVRKLDRIRQRFRPELTAKPSPFLQNRIRTSRPSIKAWIKFQ